MGWVATREIPGQVGGQRGPALFYHRRFQVQMSSGLDGKDEVLASPGIPQQYASYITATEINLGALARTRNAVQDPVNPWFWTVDVEYTTEGTPPELGDVNPLLRPPTVTRSIEKVRLAAQTWEAEDTPGVWVAKPVVNSARDAFDPPVEIERARLVYTISRFVASVTDLDHLYRMENPLNASEWLGHPPRTVKIDDLKYATVYENNIAYAREDWVLKIDPLGWDLEVLDIGFNELDGTRLKPIVDKSGRPYQVPQLLDGSGAPLPVGDEPVYLVRRVLKESEFSAYNLLP